MFMKTSEKKDEPSGTLRTIIKYLLWGMIGKAIFVMTVRECRAEPVAQSDTVLPMVALIRETHATEDSQKVSDTLQVVDSLQVADSLQAAESLQEGSRKPVPFFFKVVTTGLLILDLLLLYGRMVSKKHKTLYRILFVVVWILSLPGLGMMYPEAEDLIMILTTMLAMFI